MLKCKILIELFVLNCVSEAFSCVVYIVCYNEVVSCCV